MAHLSANVEEKLNEVVRLLARHRVLELLAERQESDKRDLLSLMQRRENLVDLQRRLRGTHPADLALIVASVPDDDRLVLFRQLPPRDAGLALVELDPEVRASLVTDLTSDDLLPALRELDADDLAFLQDALPPDVFASALEALGDADRSWLVDTSAYPEGSVGRLMRQEVAAVRIDQSAGEALAAVRSGPELPEQSDRLFLIDARHVPRGSVLLQTLIRADPETPLADLMLEVEAFSAQDSAERAAKAFERYDLSSAPVIDDVGKLIGRITIDAVLDFMRAESERDALARAGLRGAEDLFASVGESARNRWPWLAFNLLTAFIASRVIGMFEDTISQLVALAALMPIVASIGGNTGNQTIALVVRAMALGQLGDSQGQLAKKELTIGLVNGVVWGVVVGLAALVLYGQAALALVMTTAVFLNLVVAAAAGVAVPLGLKWAGRDPATGASVLLTFVTDGMGFLLFLGLARMFLV